LGEDGLYVRVYHYLMPAQQLRGNVTNWAGGGRAKVPKLDGHIWVPIDDEHTWVYNMMYGYDRDVPITPEFAWQDEAFFGRGKDDIIPGTFALKANLSNDYFIDREKQRTKTYTGIKGVNTQDFALQEGMGPICDRSQEHLGPADKGIIQMRRLLLEAVRDIADGRHPIGAHSTAANTVRPAQMYLPDDAKWTETRLKDALVAQY